jgi:hypothetical protein
VRPIPGVQNTISHDQFIKQSQQIDCVVIDQREIITSINTIAAIRPLELVRPKSLLVLLSPALIPHSP